MTTTQQRQYDRPCGIPDGSPMAGLIDEIGDALAARGQKLLWFRSFRSTNRYNVTINAGVFPADAPRTSVRSTLCVRHAIHWEWTPRVSWTTRGAHYHLLRAEFAELLASSGGAS